MRAIKSTVALRFLMLNGLSILFFALLYYFCGRIIDHNTLQKIQTTKVDLLEKIMLVLDVYILV